MKNAFFLIAGTVATAFSSESIKSTYTAPFVDCRCGRLEIGAAATGAGVGGSGGSVDWATAAGLLMKNDLIPPVSGFFFADISKQCLRTRDSQHDDPLSHLPLQSNH